MVTHVDTRFARRREIEFDTVADMVAASFMVVGQLVTTKEYTVGNGGGNRYKIVAAATGTADTGSFIDITGPDTPVQAQALRYNEVVNVRQFGAGAGVEADDTQAFRDIEAYIESVTAFRIKMFIPAGVYTTSFLPKLFQLSDLTGVRYIQGEGRFSTVINYTGSTAAFQTKTPATGGSVEGFIGDFILNYTGVASNVIGLDLSRLRYWVVSNLFVFEFDTNFKLDECFGTALYNIKSYDAVAIGIDLVSDIQGVDFYSPHVYNNAIGWKIRAANDLLVVGGITENNTLGFEAGAIDLCTFQSHYIESNTVQVAIGNLDEGSLAFDKCRFKQGVSTTDLFTVDMATAGNTGFLKVSDCVIIDDPTNERIIDWTQGILKLEWFGNQFENWTTAFTDLNVLINGAMRMDRVASDVPIQEITNSLLSTFVPVNTLKVYRSREKIVSLLMQFDFSVNLTDGIINASDLMVIQPPNFLSFPGVCDNGAAIGIPFTMRLSTAGRLRAFYTTNTDAQLNQVVQVEFESS